MPTSLRELLVNQSTQIALGIEVRSFPRRIAKGRLPLRTPRMESKIMLPYFPKIRLGTFGVMDNFFRLAKDNFTGN